LALYRFLDLGPLREVLSHEFILRREAHVSDLRLDVPEDGLEKLVFLLENELVVEDCLHGVMVAHICKHGQSLDFLLILREVEDGLRNNDIGVDFGGQVCHGGPALCGLHLQTVQHQFIFDVLAHITDVLHAHGFESLLFFNL